MEGSPRLYNTHIIKVRETHVAEWNAQGSDTLATWGGAGWGQLILSFRKRSGILDTVSRPQHPTAKYTTNSSQVTSTK